MKIFNQLIALVLVFALVAEPTLASIGSVEAHRSAIIQTSLFGSQALAGDSLSGIYRLTISKLHTFRGLLAVFHPTEWRRRPLAPFLAGAFTTNLALWFYKVAAQTWLLENTQHSGLYLGLEAFAGAFAISIFSPLGGVFADQLKPQNLARFSAVQVALVVAIGGLTVFHLSHAWLIIVFSFAFGLIETVRNPLYKKTISELTPSRDKGPLSAWDWIQSNLARAGGGAVTSILLVHLRFGQASPILFILSSLSFGLFGVILHVLRLQSLDEAPQKQLRQGILGSLVDLWTSIRRDRSLAWLMSVVAVTSFCALPVLTLLPLYVKETLHLAPHWYPFLITTFALGSVASGGYWLWRPGSVTYDPKVYKGSLFAMAASVILFALLPIPWISVMVVVAAGMAFGWFSLVNNRLVNEFVRLGYRGRTVGLMIFCTNIFLALGNIIFGTLADWKGPTNALLTMGGLLALVVMGVILHYPETGTPGQGERWQSFRPLAALEDAVGKTKSPEPYAIDLSQDPARVIELHLDRDYGSSLKEMRNMGIPFKGFLFTYWSDHPWRALFLKNVKRMRLVGRIPESLLQEVFSSIKTDHLHIILNGSYDGDCVRTALFDLLGYQNSHVRHLRVSYHFIGDYVYESRQRNLTARILRMKESFQSFKQTGRSEQLLKILKRDTYLPDVEDPAIGMNASVYIDGEKVELKTKGQDTDPPVELCYWSTKETFRKAAHFPPHSTQTRWWQKRMAEAG